MKGFITHGKDGLITSEGESVTKQSCDSHFRKFFLSFQRVYIEYNWENREIIKMLGF